MATGFGFLETCGPVERTFTPGDFPTRRFNSISGAGTTRLYGSKQFDATLELGFVLSDADTCTVLRAWDAAKGTFDTLTLPEEFFAGSGELLDCGIPDYLQWRWAEKPSVTSLLPNRSRVQIRLVATLDIK
jgi:hypothetical protein